MRSLAKLIVALLIGVAVVAYLSHRPHVPPDRPFDLDFPVTGT